MELTDRLEILSVTLLDQERARIQTLRRLARWLKLEFGWHYLLDLTWILRHLGDVSGKRIMDAGAGTGILQWYLADQGAQVLSVDRMSRAHLPIRFQRRFRIRGLRAQDLLHENPSSSRTGRMVVGSLNDLGKNLVDNIEEAISVLFHCRENQSLGEVLLYNKDLTGLDDIPDESLDAVAAVSALEHNDPDKLVRVVKELLRVLKPGGALIATLAAAKDADWFHAPSKGWCYTEASLRRIFDISSDVPSNYDQYDRLFAELVACRELRENLAMFYFRSGENGMPWGVWDPQYQPVGVIKVKA